MWTHWEKYNRRKANTNTWRVRIRRDQLELVSLSGFVVQIRLNGHFARSGIQVKRVPWKRRLTKRIMNCSMLFWSVFICCVYLFIIRLITDMKNMLRNFKQVNNNMKKWEVLQINMSWRKVDSILGYKWELAANLTL